MSCRSYDKPYGADEALKARIEDAAVRLKLHGLFGKRLALWVFWTSARRIFPLKSPGIWGFKVLCFGEAMKTPSGVCSLPFQKNCYRTASAFRLFLFTSLFERRIPSATGIFLGR